MIGIQTFFSDQNRVYVTVKACILGNLRFLPVNLRIYRHELVEGRFLGLPLTNE